MRCSGLPSGPSLPFPWKEGVAANTPAGTSPHLLRKTPPLDKFLGLGTHSWGTMAWSPFETKKG